MIRFELQSETADGIGIGMKESIGKAGLLQ
jgi:hypothetical protein